ncbi:MAG TPA: cytochrome c oxidase assembly protein [Ramlibacter sp.]
MRAIGARAAERLAPRLLGAAALPGLCASAIAHTAQDAVATSWRWSTEPWVVVPLALSAVLYAAGLARLWRRAGFGRGIRSWQAACMGGGWVALAAALVTPLDALGSRLFAAHMVQHELLMVVAAPLLVLGRPLAAWTWALAPSQRRRVGAATRWRWLAAAWCGITRPVTAWMLHAVALWAWHVPVLFEAALHHEAVHVLQHTTFLGTALLFWWAVLGGDPRSPRGGFALAYLFTTMMHTGTLGALLTFAPTVWYPAYEQAGGAFGLTPVEDQQLGGLIMWVPGGIVYVIAGLALVGRLLARPDVTPASAARPALPRSGAS